MPHLRSIISSLVQTGIVTPAGLTVLFRQELSRIWGRSTDNGEVEKEAEMIRKLLCIGVVALTLAVIYAAFAIDDPVVVAGNDHAGRGETVIGISCGPYPGYAHAAGSVYGGELISGRQGSGVLPLVQERQWPWHMGDYGYGRGMMGFWFGGFLMWITFIVVIAVAVYLIIRSTRSSTTDTLMTETPLQILKKRYARGEISKEEFDEIRKDLD